MRPLELLRLVMVNIVQNKFKVISTSLGVIVGAITIVLVIAIGQGGEKEAAKEYSGLSADTVYVNLNYQNLGAENPEIEELTPEILDCMRDENPYLLGMYLRASEFREMNLGKKKENVSVSGVTEDWETISGLKYQQGEGFWEERSAVIGGGLYEKHYVGTNPIGKKIKIGNYRYTISGVLKKSSDGLQGLNADDTVFISYEALKEESQNDEAILYQAVGKATDLKSVKPAMAGLKNTLDYYLENSSMYMVEDAGSRIDAATKSARTMKLLLISVAAIVFVVGGIGIMNVLFVTVKDRTREIGVLMALGSTQGSILVQFLMESVLIGVFSGTAGVCISFFALELMKKSEIPIYPSLQGFVAAFLFSVLTSAVFGFYPAYKASTLHPVDALNYE